MIINYFHSKKCKGCIKTDEILKNIKDIEGVPLLDIDIDEVADINDLDIAIVPCIVITQDNNELDRLIDDNITIKKISEKINLLKSLSTKY